MSFSFCFASCSSWLRFLRLASRPNGCSPISNNLIPPSRRTPGIVGLVGLRTLPALLLAGLGVLNVDCDDDVDDVPNDVRLGIPFKGA